MANPNLSEAQFSEADQAKPKQDKAGRITYHLMTKVVPAAAAANVIAGIMHGFK